jgi:hypothetical protein
VLRVVPFSRAYPQSPQLNVPNSCLAYTAGGLYQKLESWDLATSSGAEVFVRQAAHLSGNVLCQTFGALQTYEAYAATVTTLEMALKMGAVQALDGGSLASTVVSTLAALRSSTDYTTQPLDFSQDVLIAQVANHLVTDPATHVIVPKMLLLNPTDLQPSGEVDDENCSEIEKSVPEQMACLLNLRSEVATVPDYVVQALSIISRNRLG